MSPQDDVAKDSRAEGIVLTYLGTSIGALTDLGLSDEQIMEHCSAILALVRRALSPNNIESTKERMFALGSHLVADTSRIGKAIP